MRFEIMKATDQITENDYVNAMKLFTRLTPALIVIYSGNSHPDGARMVRATEN